MMFQFEALCCLGAIYGITVLVASRLQGQCYKTKELIVVSHCGLSPARPCFKGHGGHGFKHAMTHFQYQRLVKCVDI